MNTDKMLLTPQIAAAYYGCKAIGQDERNEHFKPDIGIAMERVLAISQTFKIKVRFEDARLRKVFGETDRERLQGAGSIKRDAVIWEDFLKDKNIAFEAVAPKDNKTKLSEMAFKQLTGWMGRTSNHGRDAAMLVYGF